MLVYCLWVWIWHSKWAYFQWACHPGMLRYRPIISAQKSKHLRNSSGQRTFSGLLGGFGDASDMIGDVPNKRPWMGILEDRWVGVIEWWWCWYAYRVRFNAGAQHFEACLKFKGLFILNIYNNNLLAIWCCFESDGWTKFKSSIRRQDGNSMFWYLSQSCPPLQGCTAGRGLGFCEERTGRKSENWTNHNCEEDKVFVKLEGYPPALIHNF